MAFGRGGKQNKRKRVRLRLHEMDDEARAVARAEARRANTAGRKRVQQRHVEAAKILKAMETTEAFFSTADSISARASRALRRAQVLRRAQRRQQDAWEERRREAEMTAADTEAALHSFKAELVELELGLVGLAAGPARQKRQARCQEARALLQGAHDEAAVAQDRLRMHIATSAATPFFVVPEFS